MNDVIPDAKAIFFEALDCQSPEELAHHLDHACAGDSALRARVEELLAAHREAGKFLRGSASEATAAHHSIAEQAGTVIGPYKLLQQIGEGGMGVVFMAEQTEPIQRTVALKIIKPGMDTRQVIARFEAERQAVAMMDHPNIAKVLDAGTTDTGRPYFVMELVKGVPITKYCDEKCLPLPTRLELFIQVCQAVQHAHQKGIIHRDIKPNNVLVAEYDHHAVPKVIDFGVAKATAQKLTERTMFTEFGQVLGTMEYMSPEQSKFNQLDIDTRSDIYSLGVLLYELLTGSTPFERKRLQEAAFDEMLRIIREEEPPKPSARLTTLAQEAASTVSAQRNTDPRRLSILVRGDLDWIVMRCLEKDRGRRYETANDLALDVQRYLDNEPVLASPPSWITGLTKWVHRHRTASIAASLLTLVIALGATVTTVLLAREQTATAQALQESERKERALQINNVELEKERRRAEDNLRSARAAVDHMLTRVAGDLKDVPHLTELQRALLEDALEFYQQFLQQDENDPALRYETACAYNQVGRIQQALGRIDAAEGAYKQASRLLEDLVKQFPGDRSYGRELVDVYSNQAWVLNWSGRQQIHIELRVRQLAAAKAIAARHPSDPSSAELVAMAESDLGGAYSMAGLLPQAEPHFRGAVHILDKLYQDYPQWPKNRWALAHCQLWLGNLLRSTHRNDEAEPLLLAALAIQKELFAESPNSTKVRTDLATAMHVAGGMRSAQRKFDEALQLQREAIEIYAKLLDDFPNVEDHRRTLGNAQNGLAQVLWSMGRFDDAEDAMRRALFHRGLLAKASPESMEYQTGAGWLHFVLGRRLDALGREAEAVSEYREALHYFEFAVEKFPDQAKSNLFMAKFLATCPATQFHDPQRAVNHARKALQLLPESAELWSVLGVALCQLGDWIAAEEAFVKSFKLQPKRDYPEDFFYRAIIDWRLGKPDEARRWYETGLRKWSDRLPPLPSAVRIRDEAAALIGEAKPANTAGSEPSEKGEEATNETKGNESSGGDDRTSSPD